MVRLQQLPVTNRDINAKRALEYELLKAEVTDPKSGGYEMPGGVHVGSAVIAELEDEQVGNIPSLDTVMVHHLHAGNARW
jgi:hypothetical protein